MILYFLKSFTPYFSRNFSIADFPVLAFVMGTARNSLKGCLRSIGADGDSEQIYLGAREGTVYAYSPPLAASGDRKH
ncbi:MAG: hypothetical protein DMG69_30110 [Acidobacteria bacterium]|nr:MAG: hypothetical protein DMG69_30110 [Acidobacteriota bacterium]